MTHDHKGWKPEPFDRMKLSMADVDRLCEEIKQRAETHFAEYGDGIFMHPHEIVGCMFGQQIKLSQSADASIYPDGTLDDFRERCMKTLFAMLCGTMSVDVLIKSEEK